MAAGQRRSDQHGRGDAGHPGRVGRLAAVVPAYRAEATIARALDALLTSSRIPDRLIVVASPGDATAAAAARVGVEVVTCARRVSAGAARNLGAGVASDCDLLLFVDADCRVHPRCVETLEAAVRHGGYAAAAAAVRSEGASTTDRLRHLLEFKDVEEGRPPQPPWQVASATLLCERRAFERAGGFPDLWPGEDLVLCSRLAAGGERVGLIPGALTAHRHPRGWRVMLRHQYRLGRTSAIARRITAMHGSWLARRPWLAPLLVPARAARGVAWTARRRPHALAWLLAVSPVYLLALAVWTRGFVRGAREPLTARAPLSPPTRS